MGVLLRPAPSRRRVVVVCKTIADISARCLCDRGTSGSQLAVPPTPWPTPAPVPAPLEYEPPHSVIMWLIFALVAMGLADSRWLTIRSASFTFVSPPESARNDSLNAHKHQQQLGLPAHTCGSR